MNLKFQAIYHVLLQSQYGIWTINPFKGHLVLKVQAGCEFKGCNGSWPR